MHLEYKTKKIEEFCTSLKRAKKEYGHSVAEKLHAVINLLKQSENLHDIKCLSAYRLHPLVNKNRDNRIGQLSISLGSSVYRLIIIPLDINGNKWDGTNSNMVYISTNALIILEVTNYHD